MHKLALFAGAGGAAMSYDVIEISKADMAKSNIEKISDFISNPNDATSN